MRRAALCLACMAGLALAAAPATEAGAGIASTTAASADEAGPEAVAAAPDRLDEILPEAPLILHLWATWCAPCRAELPELADFRAALPASLKARLVVVSVDTRPRADVRRFLDADMDLPGFQTYRADPAEAGGRFQITGYPLTLFLDRDGAVTRRISGAAPWPDEGFRGQAIEHLGRGS
ncbi:TlpA disulfide reductase family protein [Hoeflea sp.]|uniref:TlpA disulfide reductase family protein n=1 Tax=Hoeflea sp. TaxID=1940281 RepID=UPI00199575BA|nr:TlpA disulfide reductase family protein [Hoeflea sp.]MBC7283426.1 TlpA family protein disulfide reductase [Hoeflea sp.]